MMTKIGAGGAGSSGGLVEYLEKENKLKPEQQAELWFSQNREQLAGHEVVTQIDHNKRNLGRDDAKYYQVILAPSQAELAHIGSDFQQLQAFTRATMEQYAQNFGKGIESKDLVWFAKIEHNRHFDHTDRAVQLGEQPKGMAKRGDQTHIHVIVSRTENLQAYRQGLAEGLHKRKNPYHLSPLTNHKATTKGVVLGGFERNGFSQRVEQSFDQGFGYERGLTESFRYLHGMKYGDEGLKAELSQAASLARTQQQERSQTIELAAQQRQVELQAGLGQAYHQQDTQTLSHALDQAEQIRQAQAHQQELELSRQQALDAAEALTLNQQLEQTLRPHRGQGLGL